MGSDITRLKGKISQWLGVATGDREVEANGRAAQRNGDKPTRAEVRRETKRVKESHHDYGQRVPPQRVPHTDR